MGKLAKRLSVYAMSGMLIFSAVPGTVQAHSGRTDASGGHHDNKNVSGLGSYHYHCGGYPAHLHSGGVCPYSSSSSSSAETVIVSSGSGGGAFIGGGSFKGGAADSSTASTAAAASSNTVQLSSGNSVAISKDLIKIVQDVLSQKGYDCGTPDGVAGSKTQAALQKFISENTSDDTDNKIVKMVAEGLGIK